jgi:hypothetical protein
LPLAPSSWLCPPSSSWLCPPSLVVAVAAVAVVVPVLVAELGVVERDLAEQDQRRVLRQVRLRERDRRGVEAESVADEQVRLAERYDVTGPGLVGVGVGARGDQRLHLAAVTQDLGDDIGDRGDGRDDQQLGRRRLGLRLGVGLVGRCLLGSVAVVGAGVVRGLFRGLGVRVRAPGQREHQRRGHVAQPSHVVSTRSSPMRTVRNKVTAGAVGRRTGCVPDGEPR